MARQKKVSYTLIPRESEPGVTMYAMLRSIVNRWHEDIRAARIALAWCTSWKSDVDGRLVLGKCRKASDLDRELHEFDFVILLNAEWWQHADVKDHQREALLDHEVSHAAPKLDEDGEQVEDERDRKVWRIRKHDIEEFSGVVERHGLYKRDLEVFAVALRRRQGSLLDLSDDIDGVKDAKEMHREITRRMLAGEDGSDVLHDILARSAKDEARH